MIVTASSFKRVTYAKNLDSTALVNLVTCNSGFDKTVESILVSCGDTGTDFTLVYNNGTTDFPLLNERAISAHDTFVLTDVHVVLSEGRSLKVKASAADQLTVVAVTLDGSSKASGVPGV